MRKVAEDFYNKLARVTQDSAVTDAAGKKAALLDGIDLAGQIIVNQAKAGGKVMFIGNGANTGISSHMSVDFWKNGGIRSAAFTDPALLTTIGNDCGFENLFAKPLGMFADPVDVLIAMSSSGKSPNVLRGVDVAKAKGCKVITLTGFTPENPLRKMGDLNFYVPHESYALVEVAHHSICHCILEAIMTSGAMTKK